MQTKILFAGTKYTVCDVTGTGLVIQRKDGTGVLLKPEHPQYGQYRDAFAESPPEDETLLPLHIAEMNKLCRELLRAY